MEQQPWIPKLYDTFGDRLHLMRRRLGKTVVVASEDVGLPHQSWYRWEGKGTLPRDMPDVVSRISKTFGVDREWLMYGWEGIGADALNGESSRSRCTTAGPFGPGVSVTDGGIFGGWAA